MSVGGIAAVLGVEAADIFSEDVQCINRICFSVEDHIGSVQVDGQIGAAGLFKAAQHGDRRFLSCLKQKVLAVFFQMLCHSADSGAEALKFRVVWILGDEAHMGGHIGDPQKVGKVGSVGEIPDARLAVLRGDKSQGKGAFVKVPHFGAFPAAPESGDGHGVVLKHVFQICGIFCCPEDGIPGQQLAGVEAVLPQQGEFAGHLSYGRECDAGSYFHLILLFFQGGVIGSAHLDCAFPLRGDGVFPKGAYVYPTIKTAIFQAVLD